MTDDDDDDFYESLDRILSSSNSSTSSDADADDDDDRRRRPLDVWISEPSSVADRRRGLLLRLGLSADPSFSRLKSLPRFAKDDSPSSPAAADSLSPRPRSPPSVASPVGRSRSEGFVADLGEESRRCRRNESIHFPVALVKADGLMGRSRAWSSGDAGGLIAKGGDEEGRNEAPLVDEGKEEGVGDEVSGCLIKNLDNGKEFVVKEFRGDGVWEKVRDVVTGKQLTVEELGMCVGGSSRIVQELMRRRVGESSPRGIDSNGVEVGMAKETKVKKKGGWLRNIRNIAEAMVNHHSSRELNGDDRDMSLEKGLRSATDESQDGAVGLRNVDSRRIKVRHHGKSQKELTWLFMNQEIKAHDGPIWSMKFSLDGRYLASAGEDCVIHLWEVVEVDKRGGESSDEKASEGSPICNPFAVAVNNCSAEPASQGSFEGNFFERIRSNKVHGFRKYVNSEPLMVPEHVFSLSEKPICSFRGHQEDVLDLSWSKSLHLLSSSMDKTVRLWHMSSKVCLKIFSHSDYVTCIQFNPLDDRYFISGSLDEKVRIWSIPDRRIVDWNDIHEMVTAVSYTPDGKGAFVGSHKGSCHLYDTSDNKLLQKSQIETTTKKKSRLKKITGFQFAPGSSTKVLITSADSRIRLVDGDDLVYKFKGFRNTSSQISAHFTPNGKYLICASEDSNVYLWRYEDNSRPSRNITSVIQSYEQFFCEGVTVAIPWSNGTASNIQYGLDGESQPSSPSLLKITGQHFCPSPAYKSANNQQLGSIFSPKAPSSNRYNDRVSATWPEELMTDNKQSLQHTADLLVGGMTAPSRSAWGLVIVTAGRGGEIRTFQNYGFPVRI